MLAAKRKLGTIVGALVLSGVVVLLSSRARSQPKAQFPPEQPVALSARVAALEQRAHRLEQRLAAFERVGMAAKNDGSYQLSVNGTSVTIEQDGRVTVSPKAPSPGSPAIAGRLPPAAAECDPPYTIDATGARSPKPGCFGTASAECDPPYYFDSDGIKRFIPKCL
jgi:hypothetical protein